MNALGRHLLLELNDCNKEALDDLSYLRSILVSAAEGAGATVLGESFHRFAPQGVSGVVIIAESHVSIHSWPEYGYAAVDIFTCGDTVQPEMAAEYLVKHLKSRCPSLMEVKRGLSSPPVDLEEYGRRPTQMVV
ncbi:MAG: adenosylmethionine decarboxylase [Chloroflexota bacterium]|nr:adenosylmethionine decarboxylase [Chloroflexota bacterium]